MSNVPANAHQIVILLDDDVMITDGLAAGLSREGRTIITCNDLETAHIAVQWINPSHIVSDVRLSGPFAFEGLDFINFAKKHSPDARVILMTGDAPDSLQMEASHRGAVAFLQKPFEVAELDAFLDLMAPFRTGSPDWPDIIRMPLLDEILASPLLSVVFQPIMRLASGEAVGYEALARYKTDSPLRDPQMLFRYATNKNRVADLEMACIRRSLRAGAGLAAASPLFLNIHPSVFAAGDQLQETIVAETDRFGISLNRVVLEITEQGNLHDDRKTIESIRNLKELGVRFAFDDVGVAYSHLPFVDRIHPAFLKISQQFGTAFESDETKMKIVRNILSLARDFDSELILEGIESERTAAAAENLGIKYGQGFYFARPTDASAFA